MRKIREVLRLHHECGCENRQIALACCISPSTVSEYLQKAERLALTWELAKGLSEADVESRLFTHVGRCEPPARVAIDFDWVHREMRRDAVTLQLLWGDYQKAAHETGRHPYQYSQFCELYSNWRGAKVRLIAAQGAVESTVGPGFTNSPQALDRYCPSRRPPGTRKSSRQRAGPPRPATALWSCWPGT